MEEYTVSKRAPELTWQDIAILVSIPIVVLAIFIITHYLNRDISVTEAFSEHLPKVEVRDNAYIIQILQDDSTIPATTSTNTQRIQKFRARTKDGQTEFTFQYNIIGTETMALKIGRSIQFYGQYQYSPDGGIVEVPYKTKSGRYVGWVVYDNKRYYPHEEVHKNTK